MKSRQERPIASKEKTNNIFSLDTQSIVEISSKNHKRIISIVKAWPQEIKSTAIAKIITVWISHKLIRSILTMIRKAYRYQLKVIRNLQIKWLWRSIVKKIPKSQMILRIKLGILKIIQVWEKLIPKTWDIMYIYNQFFRKLLWTLKIIRNISCLWQIKFMNKEKTMRFWSSKRRYKQKSRNFFPII